MRAVQLSVVFADALRELPAQARVLGVLRPGRYGRLDPCQDLAPLADAVGFGDFRQVRQCERVEFTVDAHLVAARETRAFCIGDVIRNCYTWHLI